jgi:hypothetical protein
MNATVNITNARYVQKTVDTSDGTIQYDGVNYAIIAEFDGVEIQVPINLKSYRYAEIMRQVEAGELVIQEADEGNAPLPADEPVQPEE